MALDPLIIKEERAKIPQFQAEGNITSSKLIKEDNECLHTYESTINTGSEEISFDYSVLAGECVTDSIYDIEVKPFAKNTNVTLSLTAKEPYKMVTSKINFVTESSEIQTPTPNIFIGVLAVVLVTLGIILLRYFNYKRK